MTQPYDFNNFIKDAIRTESTVPTVTVSPTFFADVMRLAILASEFVDQIKKHIYYKKQDENDPSVYLPRPIDPEKAPRLLAELLEVVQRLHNGGLAHEIANPTEEALPVNTRLTHAFIGKYTESGELLKALLKAFEAGVDVDKVNLREELGDDKWYDAIAFDELDADFGAVCDLVIAKLKKRYADKFGAIEAEVRNLAAERKVLESGS